LRWWDCMFGVMCLNRFLGGRVSACFQPVTCSASAWGPIYPVLKLLHLFRTHLQRGPRGHYALESCMKLFWIPFAIIWSRMSQLGYFYRQGLTLVSLRRWQLNSKQN